MISWNILFIHSAHWPLRGPVTGYKSSVVNFFGTVPLPKYTALQEHFVCTAGSLCEFVAVFLSCSLFIPYSPTPIVLELRMTVRSSLYRPLGQNHTHAYGPESHDADSDEFFKICTTCGHRMSYEKMWCSEKTDCINLYCTGRVGLWKCGGFETKPLILESSRNWIRGALLLLQECQLLQMFQSGCTFARPWTVLFQWCIEVSSAGWFSTPSLFN